MDSLNLPDLVRKAKRDSCKKKFKKNSMHYIEFLEQRVSIILSNVAQNLYPSLCDINYTQFPQIIKLG